MEVWELPGGQIGHFPRGWFLLQLSPSDDPDSVYVYDLMATVVHILDSRTGGSLVGHIKVGETYHQRKEVRSCGTCGSSPAPWAPCLAQEFLPRARLGSG